MKEKILHLDISPSEVLSQIELSTEKYNSTNKFFIGDKKKCDYYSEIEDGEFRIFRKSAVLSYQDYGPVLLGYIDPDDDGSILNLKISMQASPLVFSIAIILLFGLIILVMLIFFIENLFNNRFESAFLYAI